MSVVALISQPLRASHCAAYVRSIDPTENVVIIASDEQAFDSLGLPEDIDIHSAMPPTGKLPSQPLTSGGLRRRITRWARGGSRLGMKFDQFMRSASWKLRYLDRLVSVNRARVSQTRQWVAGQEAISEELARLHGSEPISLVAVFDVFDLPAALSFARQRDIPVEVR